MFKFSIIIPYENNGGWLSDSIESLLTQNLDFYNNVEVILVNCNSSNTSTELADYWEQLFPCNIKSLISNDTNIDFAYSLGYKNSTGEYIVFLDEKILFSKDALEKIYFFHREYPNLKIISLPLGDLDGTFDELNEIYFQSREINIEDEPQSILVRLSNVFIERNLLYPFFDSLSLCGGGLALTELILTEKRYGVISDSQLFYRKRKLIQYNRDDRFYNEFNEKISGIWLEKYIEDRRIPQYLQNVLMYHLQWAIKQRILPMKLSVEEITDFRKNYLSLISSIDVENIMKLQHLSQNQKRFLINKNLEFNKSELQYVFNNQDVNLFADGIFLSSLSKSSFEIISIVSNKNKIGFWCKLNTMFDSEQISLFLNSQDRKSSKELPILNGNEVILFGEPVGKELTFEFSIPFDELSFDTSFISIRVKETTVKMSLSKKTVLQLPKLLFNAKIQNLSYDILESNFIIKKAKKTLVKTEKKTQSEIILKNDVIGKKYLSHLTLYQKIKRKMPRSLKRKIKKILKQCFHITVWK